MNGIQALNTVVSTRVSITYSMKSDTRKLDHALPVYHLDTGYPRVMAYFSIESYGSYNYDWELSLGGEMTSHSRYVMDVMQV